jgi:hypothetical protein
VVLSAVAALLAGCGEAAMVDGPRATTLVQRAMTQQVHADVQDVSCPTGLTARADRTFRCVVTGTDGSRGNAVVTITDDEGSLRVAAPFLPTDDVEASIASGLRERAGAKVRVTCPDLVALKSGAHFTCEARSGADSSTVTVVQQDAKGRVSYEVDQH